MWKSRAGVGPGLQGTPSRGKGVILRPNPDAGVASHPSHRPRTSSTDEALAFNLPPSSPSLQLRAGPWDMGACAQRSQARALTGAGWGVTRRCDLLREGCLEEEAAVGGWGDEAPAGLRAAPGRRGSGAPSSHPQPGPSQVTCHRGVGAGQGKAPTGSVREALPERGPVWLFLHSLWPLSAHIRMSGHGRDGLAAKHNSSGASPAQASVGLPGHH